MGILGTSLLSHMSPLLITILKSLHWVALYLLLLVLAAGSKSHVPLAKHLSPCPSDTALQPETLPEKGAEEQSIASLNRRCYGQGASPGPPQWTAGLWWRHRWSLIDLQVLTALLADQPLPLLLSAASFPSQSREHLERKVVLRSAELKRNYWQLSVLLEFRFCNQLGQISQKWWLEMKNPH